MRISDWSSDVCSSDLGSELDWIDENRGHDMIGARPRLFNQGKMPLMQRAHGGHQRDSLPGARRAASPQGGDGFAQQRKFTDDLHVDKGSDKGGHCLRSEEHTSELQSLMRISYAVFCLKKKKMT